MSRLVLKRRLGIRRDHALGTLDDVQSSADGVMAKLQTGINARRGLLVVVDGWTVFALRPDAFAAGIADQREIVGLYYGGATRGQIADDLRELMRIEATARAA